MNLSTKIIDRSVMILGIILVIIPEIIAYYFYEFLDRCKEKK